MKKLGEKYFRISGDDYMCPLSGIDGEQRGGGVVCGHLIVLVLVILAL